jgi:hypothetical protein
MHAAASTDGPSSGPTQSKYFPKSKDLGSQLVYVLKNKLASAFYLDCMLQNGGHVPTLADARRKPEAERVLTALKAMTGREEMQVLVMTERDKTQQAHAVSLSEAVVEHLRRRLLREYADKQDTKTPGRLATDQIKVNTLDKHLLSSKLNVSSSAFAAWRADPSAPIQGSISAMLGSRKRPMLVGDDDVEVLHGGGHADSDSDSDE